MQSWHLVLALVAFESAALVVLLLPMLSNEFRGLLIHGASSVWGENKLLKGVSLCVFAIQLAVLADAINDLWTLAPAADDGLLMTIIQSNLVLKHQRDAFLGGVGVLLWVFNQRIAALQRYLYSIRAENKQSTGKDVPPGPAQSANFSDSVAK